MNLPHHRETIREFNSRRKMLDYCLVQDALIFAVILALIVAASMLDG
jgi:hypothetical protein